MNYTELLAKINNMYMIRNINIMNNQFEPYDRYINEFYLNLNKILNKTPEEESLVQDFISLYELIPQTK